MTIVSTSNADHYTWGEQCDGWHLVQTTTLSVILETMPPGSAEVRHRHDHAEQFFYVLSGVASFEINGAAFQIRAEQGIHVPPRTPHQIRNEHTEPLEFLVTSTPPSHGDRTELEPVDSQ